MRRISQFPDTVTFHDQRPGIACPGHIYGAIFDNGTYSSRPRLAALKRNETIVNNRWTKDGLPLARNISEGANRRRRIHLATLGTHRPDMLGNGTRDKSHAIERIRRILGHHARRKRRRLQFGQLSGKEKDVEAVLIFPYSSYSNQKSFCPSETDSNENLPGFSDTTKPHLAKRRDDLPFSCASFGRHVMPTRMAVWGTLIARKTRSDACRRADFGSKLEHCFGRIWTAPPHRPSSFRPNDRSHHLYRRFGHRSNYRC